MWAVVGLGNPGRRYAATRHNVGFALIERIAERWEVRLKKRKYQSKAVQVERRQDIVLLVKPWTYMNQSGLAVKDLVRRTGLMLKHLLVVYDDLDIPLGEIRIRREGGPGTHNGMISIIQEIGSTQFPRIRIGIGPLPSGIEATDFVLSGFVKDQRPALDGSLAMAEEAVMLILDRDIEKAMNRFNRKPRGVGAKNRKESEES